MARRKGSARVSGRRRLSLNVEGLESRRLLAVATTAQYGTPSQPVGITTGADGNLWFTGNYDSGDGFLYTPSGQVGWVNPSTGAVNVLNLPRGVVAGAIAAGPDGNIWFTESNGIGEVDLTTHAISAYPLPAGGSAAGLVSGPGGLLWFTDSSAGKIGSIDPTTHQVVEYPLASTSSGPNGIAVGADGDLWFTESHPHAIGVFDPTTKAVVGEFPIPTAGSAPGAIAAGPGGVLYFSETLEDKIGSIDPTSHAIAEYFLPSGSASPLGITTGPDGNIYFVAMGLTAGFGDVSAIGEFNVATRAVTIFPVPGEGTENSNILGYLRGITTGPDGNLWSAGYSGIDASVILPPGDGLIAANVVTDPTGNVTFAGGGPLGGRTIYLDLKGDGTLDPGDPTAVTNAMGYALFSGGVAPGTYTVRLVSYPGEVPTFQGFARTVTVAAGQVVETPTFAVLETSSILPMTFSTAPFGPSNPDVSTAEVVGLYRIYLDRAPDPAGEANAVAYLKNGGSLRGLGLILGGSAEYDARVVAGDYENFLGRAGSSGEVAYWVGLMQQGASAEYVAYLMLSSDGFSAEHASDASFVQALYNDLLGRQASDAEVAAWVSYLGGSSRAALAYAFVFGSPAMARAVEGMGSIFWASPPNQATVDYCVSFLTDGQLTLTGVAASFAASDTFIARANATVG